LWPSPGLLKREKLQFLKVIAAYSLILYYAGLLFLSLGSVHYFVVNDVSKVAEYFHEQVNQDALVETYESELLFFLDQPLHIPPDQMQVDLNRYKFLGETRKLSYDPVVYAPDYIVVGVKGAFWELYDPVIADGRFVLDREFVGYKIYRRKR
jgi:hypothetical protein